MLLRKSLITILNELSLLLIRSPVYHPRFWIDEREKRPRPPSYGWPTRFRTLLAGFNSDKYLLYRFDVNDKRQYLNDIRRRILSERISKHHYYIVHNKIVFDKYFSSICTTIPKLAFIDNARLMPLVTNCPFTSLDELICYTTQGHDLCLKPFDGGSGRDILQLSFDHDRLEFAINGQPHTSDDLRSRLHRLNGFVVEHRCNQSGLSNEIYPGTLNTLRIMTMIDPDSGDPFVPVALHRFGTLQSRFADNWSQGGLSVWIDVDSGIMGKGVQYPFNGQLVFHSHHPDTKIRIEGRSLLQWHRVLEVVVKCATFVRFMPMLGWDVVLSDDAILVLEANYNPDINLIQVHRPLLVDERVKRFFAYHKVLR